jgi:hypothetical protein
MGVGSGDSPLSVGPDAPQGLDFRPGFLAMACLWTDLAAAPAFGLVVAQQTYGALRIVGSVLIAGMAA